MYSIPGFDLPLWIICTVGSSVSLLLYLVIAGIFAGIGKRIGKRRGWCDLDYVGSAVFWPIVWPGILLFQIPRWICNRIAGE